MVAARSNGSSCWMSNDGGDTQASSGPTVSLHLVNQSHRIIRAGIRLPGRVGALAYNLKQSTSHKKALFRVSPCFTATLYPTPWTMKPCRVT